MPMRFAFLLAACCATPAIAGPLSGTFSSPMGSVAVSESDGNVKAVIADKKNPCNLPKGAVVLEGSRLDDSVVGTLHSCKLGDGCAGPVEGAAMLLITRSGAAISGAVHLDAGKQCTTPLKGDSVAFKRGGSTSTAPKVDAKAKGTPRERALALAKDAAALKDQGDAEGARAKFQEAVQTDPTYAEGYIGVGVTFYMRERYDEAIDWYKKAIDANPAVADSYYNMACVYALRGDKPQALRYLRISLMNGYVQLNTFADDPDLKSLKDDPTFEKYKKGQFD
jgi:hypothetical protein